MTDYSPELRSALSEALALVANQHSDLKHIGSRSRWAPAAAVRKLVEHAPAERWIKLSPQLPTLAEAAPDVFLDGIDHLLLDESKVLAIYAEEGKGVFGGGNPMTGILWALEVLAWSPEYLPRATLALGGFDRLDPGGSWGNRALSSLTRIYLPWLPQTLAEPSKRMSALLALSKDYTSTAWSLYLSLLPGVAQTSSGTQKPRWLVHVPEENATVSRKDYWEQIECYAARAVELAEQSNERLRVLSTKLDVLPEEAFNRAISTISSKADIVTKEIRYEIWRELVRVADRHRRSPDADWVMGESRITAVEAAAVHLQPSAPTERYLPLFASDNYDLFHDDDWNVAQLKLVEAQKTAASEIWESEGVAGIELFSTKIDTPFAFGWSLGASSPEELPEPVLRGLTKTASGVDFAAGYISQGETSGDRPLVNLAFTDWLPSEIANVLSRTRIEGSTAWKVAERALGLEKMLFWRQADALLISTTDDLHHAVAEYLLVGRPLAAIRAIHSYAHRYGSIDELDASTALLAASVTDESPSTIDSYALVNLIERLQKSVSVDASELFKIEWAYLELLNRPGGAYPITLERKLSNDPSFFCGVVRAIFRSKDALEPTVEPTKRERRNASNAYRLLMNWKTPPGTLQNAPFNGGLFSSWLRDVTLECSRTGHLEVALHQVGPVLVHVPADPSGLWIDAVVAEQLNRQDMEELRSGYRTGIFNSRGVHWVDPSGKPEMQLAAEFTQRAEAADSRGLARLAFTMRQLAKEYATDATRIRLEHIGSDVAE